MPYTETTVIDISCDNPDCPGNTLDATSRLGWLFVTAEVYNASSTNHVFCCSDCVSMAAAAPSVFDPPPG
jgi:hypothetical protein